MNTRRLFAALVGFISLVAAGFVTAPASAAPVASGAVPTAQQAAATSGELLSTVRYYGRRHYGYGRPVYYRRPVYRRPVYYRPIYRPVRCGVVYQRVWTGYGWRVRPVRTCRRY